MEELELLSSGDTQAAERSSELNLSSPPEEIGDEIRNLKSSCLTDGDNVYLSSCVSLNQFFVIRQLDLLALDQLRSELSEEWKKRASIENVKINDTLVLKRGLLYHRVKVLCVKYPHICVSYVDLGGTTTVSISSLRQLPVKYSVSSLAPLAHQCSLELSKYSHGAWDKNAISLFREFCGAGTFIIEVVISKSSSFGTGNLTVVDVVKYHNGVPVNLLQFMSYRDVLFNSDIQFLDSSKIKEALPTQHLDPLSGDSIVRIVHVKEPSEFYISLESSTHIEHEVSESMKEMYYGSRKEFQRQQHQLLVPYVGLVCAIKDDHTGSYQRAKIVLLVEKPFVIVQLVDIGRSYKANFYDLLKLNVKLLEFPALAFPVRLRNVRPACKSWTVESQDYTNNILLNSSCRLTVVGASDEGRPFVLIHTIPDGESFQDNLVKFGFAVYTDVFEGPKEDVGTNVGESKEIVNDKAPSQLAMTKGEKHLCRILKVDNPDKICGRKISEVDSFFEFSRRLSLHVNSLGIIDEEMECEIGSYCVVRSLDHNWARAIVEKCDESKLVLTLIDYGEKITSSLKLVRKIPCEYASKEPYCLSMRLVNLLPAGGGDWTLTACETLGELLASSDWQVEVEVLECQSDNGIWPVRIIAREQCNEIGPLDPDSTIDIDVREKLISAGLAIPLDMKSYDVLDVSEPEGLTAKSRHVCVVDYEVLRTDTINFKTELDDIKDEVDIRPQTNGGDYHIAENSTHDVDNVKPDVASVQDDTQVFISTDQTGPEKEMESGNKFTWLSQDVSKSSFQAVGAYVDWDASIYMVDVNSTKVLQVVNKILNHKYLGSEPSNDDDSWVEGEACIVRYCEDHKWYRGVVAKLPADGKVLVRFVDYGSLQLCFKWSLRKKLYCTEFPIQCIKAQLNVDPVNSRWDQEVLDFIHEMVVDQDLRISVIDIDCKPIVVEVETFGGINVANLLTSNEYAIARS